MQNISRPKWLVILKFLLLTIAWVEIASAQAPGSALRQTGKIPVIIIPGITGSELINKNTNETVWFKITKPKDDSLRLPISSDLSQNHDDLVPGDILRSVKYLKFLPETEIYQRLTESLENSAGYKEEKWASPSGDGFEDCYYVFPYDWRLDNVENARLLIRKMEGLKTKLKRPNLRFNIIAHSMGGLIARYAARFGDSDIPGGNLKPTWAGARHINKILLVGTPNEGSISALNSLINGSANFEVRGLTLPFLMSVNKFDTFTLPSAFQLLPHAETAHIYDENFKPLKIDIYDPEVWEKYRWVAYEDSRFAREFNPEEQIQARKYFRLVLSRAQRFHESLESDPGAKSPVALYLFGADCRPTLDAMIVYHDDQKGEWKSIFKPDSFTRNDGSKASYKELNELMFTAGDGVVTKDSLLTARTRAKKTDVNGYKTSLSVNDVYFACENHNQLTGNLELQRRMFQELVAK